MELCVVRYIRYNIWFFAKNSSVTILQSSSFLFSIYFTKWDDRNIVY